MNENLLSVVLWILIFLGSVVSVEFGLTVAIVEISLGVIGGNFFGLHPTPWITFFAGFGGILLTFLAGTEIDTQVMKEKFKESFLIGIADTSYKKEIAKVFEEIGRRITWHDLGEGFDQNCFRFQILDEGNWIDTDWRQELERILKPQV